MAITEDCHIFLRSAHHTRNMFHEILPRTFVRGESCKVLNEDGAQQCLTHILEPAHYGRTLPFYVNGAVIINFDDIAWATPTLAVRLGKSTVELDLVRHTNVPSSC